MKREGLEGKNGLRKGKDQGKSESKSEASVLKSRAGLKERDKFEREVKV